MHRDYLDFRVPADRPAQEPRTGSIRHS
jgi:hypothetical protein